MNILLVYAHSEPRSFTAAMHNLALDIFTRKGHTVKVTDLYGVGFNPVAGKYDFSTIRNPAHFNYMFEQLEAAKNDWSYAPDIVDEIQKLKEADMVYFHFPLWWNAPPAILKGWLDRVLTMGTAWDGEHLFSTGKYRGKVAGVTVTAGDPEVYYRPDGLHKATVQQMLYPLLHGTLAYCGFHVLEPFAVYGLTAANTDALDAQLQAYKQRLETMEDAPRFLYKF